MSGLCLGAARRVAAKAPTIENGESGSDVADPERQVDGVAGDVGDSQSGSIFIQ